MLKPHNHSEFDADLVTYQASVSDVALARHMVDSHGVSEAYAFNRATALKRHAEEHAIALSPEDQGVATEAEKRAYAADLLRHLAINKLAELDFARLPVGDGDSVSIVALDEVESWLLGLATRVQNGANL